MRGKRCRIWYWLLLWRWRRWPFWKRHIFWWPYYTFKFRIHKDRKIVWEWIFVKQASSAEPVSFIFSVSIKSKLNYNFYLFIYLFLWEWNQLKKMTPRKDPKREDQLLGKKTKRNTWFRINDLRCEKRFQELHLGLIIFKMIS